LRSGLFPFSTHSLAVRCGELVEKSWGSVEDCPAQEFVTFPHLTHLMR